MQPEFVAPEFVENSTAEEIHERMMESLPADIDDMPGGFAYDFTMPAAVEKSELIEFHLTRALMIAFPQYAWDEWLNLHGEQVHVIRHPEQKATGYVTFTGAVGTEIPAGTVVCVPAMADMAAIEYSTDEDCMIGEDGSAEVAITAVNAAIEANVQAGAVSIMEVQIEDIIEITNPAGITGGQEQETDDDYYDRIKAEYENNKTYLGNDADYIRWAKEAGAGDCKVVPAFDGPGTVKLILTDRNGQPASEGLMQTVYDYIVSPFDRSKRLLPTACAKLTCGAPSVVTINYECTGILHSSMTDLERIKADFSQAVQQVYALSMPDRVLRYNDIRPLMRDIEGVEDFETFRVNGEMKNIFLGEEEYPETGDIVFSQGQDQEALNGGD